MGWTAHRTTRGTLHVINDEDGSHFEAENEDIVNDTIDSINASKREAAEAERQRALQTDALTMPVGDVPTPRGN